MQQGRVFEFLVGLFILAGLGALFVLAFKVSGMTHIGSSSGYYVTAEFDQVGDLKPRAPVTVAGVQVGEVKSIVLDNESFKAKVTLFIRDETKRLPTMTTASILTQGLLGANYISLNPDFALDETDVLKNGDMISNTYSALILEELIGKFLFKVKDA